MSRRTRPAKSRTPTVSEDGVEREFISLDSSDEGGTPPQPRQGSGSRSLTVVGKSLTTAPSLDSTESQSSRKALDIKYFFTPTSDGTERCCISCQTKYDQDPTNVQAYRYALTTSNSTLRNHLDKHHKEEYMRLAKQKGWRVQLASMKDAIIATPSTQLITFSKDAVLRQLVRFIVSNDQALNVVEDPEFRNLLLMFRDDFQEKDLPRRTKVRELIVKAWSEWFDLLVADLKKAVGSHSFTADAWSDRKRQSYICITVHWLAWRDPQNLAGLELKSAIVAFHKIQGDHSGANMAKIVHKLLARAGINGGEKSFWTLDNAAVNDVLLESLGSIYEQQEPPVAFKFPNCRVMCFPHIMNIVVTHTIEALNDNIATDGPGETDDEELLAQDKAPANVLSRARRLVVGLRASGQRIEALKNVIENGNQLNLWGVDKKENPIQIKFKMPIRDVPTRWDSTYMMLNRLLELQKPIQSLLSSSTSVTKDITKFRLSDSDWSSVIDMVGVLQHAHKFQLVMAVQKTPMLAGVIPSFERFMSAWENLVKLPETKHLHHAIETGLSFAYKYYNKMDNTDAYVVAMFIHPGIRMSWVSALWDKDYRKKAEKTIISLLEEYRRKHPLGAQPPKAPPAEKSNLGWINRGLPNAKGEKHAITLPEHFQVDDSDMDWGEQSFEAEAVESVETEYRKYTKGLDKRSIDAPILPFWESARLTFPTIFHLAMDYLAIQASAVPCERAFSSSAETDTERRNRISPVLMEVLQMLKYGYRNEGVDFRVNYTTEEELYRTPPQNVDDVLEAFYKACQREDLKGKGKERAVLDAQDAVLGSFEV